MMPCCQDHRQGSKMAMGPNNIVIVWAPVEFLFILCFYKLIKYISLIFRIKCVANDKNPHHMAHPQIPQPYPCHCEPLLAGQIGRG
jgi:hypothetical protein